MLLFFLLHEQPAEVRRRTLSQAMRVVKPGGRVVIVDYHRPAPRNLLRLPMRLVFRMLEPCAIDLWNHEIAHYIAAADRPASSVKTTCFGGLYQRLVLTR